MSQQHFSEIDPNTYFPDGYETYQSGLTRLANEWFPTSWHGENEFIRRNDPYDPSVSRLSVEGYRMMLAGTLDEDQLAQISDDVIAEKLAADRSDEHVAELEAPLRYRKLVEKLRAALIDSKISLVALAADGSDVALPSQYWKSNFAVNVLYAGTCQISNDSFAARESIDFAEIRWLIYNSESISQCIAHRSSRPDLSNEEVFSKAIEWLSREMRKSPSRRPSGMSKAESRKNFNKTFDYNLTERRWKEVWKSSIKAAGAKAWSKPGPTKAR